MEEEGGGAHRNGREQFDLFFGRNGVDEGRGEVET